MPARPPPFDKSTAGEAPRHIRWLLAVLFLGHAVLGAVIGLSVDEAHYLLYAAHPALSYFDHPPLVGWVQWPLVALDLPVWFLRLLPGLLWLVTVAGVYRLTLRLAPMPVAEGAGLWAVLVLVLAPLLHVLGIGLLPDTLLIALTVALMHVTLTLVHTEPVAGHTLKSWALLGLVLGLAGLSKYTAVLLVVPVALCLLAAHGLRLLRSPGPWVAALIALACILPVLIWNAQNQWVSFVYQLRHGAGDAWHFANVIRFLLVQAVAYGPLLWWGLLRADSGPRYWVAFFAVPFLVFAFMSGGGSGLPHWTAPAWVALAPLAGVVLAQAWARGRKRLIAGLAALQLLASLALPALMVTAGVPGMQANPFADLHGWDLAGERAKRMAVERGITTLAVSNWTLGSRIGWYARPMPVQVLDERFDQFDLWVSPLPHGARVVWVNWSQLPHTVPVGPAAFGSCALIDSMPVQRMGSTIAVFEFYDCTGWSGKSNR